MAYKSACWQRQVNHLPVLIQPHLIVWKKGSMIFYFETILIQLIPVKWRNLSEMNFKGDELNKAHSIQLSGFWQGFYLLLANFK